MVLTTMYLVSPTMHFTFYMTLGTLPHTSYPLLVSILLVMLLPVLSTPPYHLNMRRTFHFKTKFLDNLWSTPTLAYMQLHTHIFRFRSCVDMVATPTSPINDLDLPCKCLTFHKTPLLSIESRTYYLSKVANILSAWRQKGITYSTALKCGYQQSSTPQHVHTTITPAPH